MAKKNVDVEQENEDLQETIEQETTDAAPAEEIDETAKKIEELEAALAAQQEQYQRMLAEYANYKRRTEQEKESIGQFAKSDILRQLLPSLDNLERAVDAPDGPDYRKGVDMIIDKLHEELEKLGLKEIPALGAPFDPELHHAVMREDAEDIETETVTEVFQKGYTFGERVIRPAMVKVAN